VVFGGLFDLRPLDYNSAETVLIGATDGVRNQTTGAVTGQHETVGLICCMCDNDQLSPAVRPFLGVILQTGHLEIEEAAAVVKGIAEGCRQSNCGLVESEECPSMLCTWRL
jgi:phosphoribosylamine--glycine ligase/phosphoribosylglycinamide formyltransferase/phosphoribosylformylglycinamidine cyclo-ligase/phosphoribosylamine--glycine ligase/phosphoribosylformylglycinamidine cyclo-ligase